MQQQHTAGGATVLGPLPGILHSCASTWANWGSVVRDMLNDDSLKEGLISSLSVCLTRLVTKCQPS